jgi:hypothetical protein
MLDRMSDERRALPRLERPAALIRKDPPREVPVTAQSNVLFRLGEQCNNHCPMCTNTGRRELFFFDTEELLRRVERVRGWGVRRVVLTGGEPTIHPGFWALVDALHAHGMCWDINTHGRSFAADGAARKARARGLVRAIVSLHSHEEEASCALSGMTRAGHGQTLSGIDRLIDAGVEVTINCVLSTYVIGKLEAFLRDMVRQFGAGLTVKLAFPSLFSKGHAWPPIQLRYEDVRDEVRGLPGIGRDLGITVQFESVPSCILGRADAVDVGRFGFGETHYLDDLTGDRLYGMEWVEAQSMVFARECVDCPAFPRCSGVSVRYAERFGVDALVPFARAPLPWWHPGR